MVPMGGRLAKEIRQAKPFGSLEEEAVLNLRRTSAFLEQAESDLLKPHGLSIPQYNVLRILRGAGEKGLACQEIAGRMIARDPDVTRLLDRLEARGLIARARSGADRRVVLARIAEPGRRLLASTDAEMRELPRRLLRPLGGKRLRILIGLLERARGG